MSRRCKVPFSRRAYYRSHGGGLSTDEESLSQYSVHPVPNAEPTRNEYAKINSCDMSHGDTTPHGDLNVSVDSNCNHGNPTCSRCDEDDDPEDSVDVGIRRVPKKFPAIITPKPSINSNKSNRMKGNKQQGAKEAVTSKSNNRTKSIIKSNPKRHAKSGFRLAPVRPLHASGDQVDYVRSTDNFTCLDIIIYLVSIGSYLADVGTDIWVAYMYYNQRHTMWFILTLLFVLVPGITTTLFSIAWYMQDHKYQKSSEKGTNDCTVLTEVSKVRWASRTICLLLQLGPVIRYVECLLYGMRSKKQRDWYVMLAFEDTDSTMLRLIECFMEAAPQLVLQLYIMMTIGLQDGWLLVVGQIASCFTSLASVSWALAAYHRSLRYSLRDKANMTYAGIALQFFWRFFTIGSRVIALAMFASCYSYWAFIAVACHWILMFSWILAQKTQFCHTRFQEVFFDIVVAIVYVFCYLNLLEGHTRLRYIFYYTLTYIENIGLMVAWYAVAGTSTSWYKTPAMVAVFAGLFVGLTFMLAYYKFLHPNNISEEFSDKQIKLCVPWKDLYLCQLPQEGSTRPVSGDKSHELEYFKSDGVNHQNQV